MMAPGNGFMTRSERRFEGGRDAINILLLAVWTVRASKRRRFLAHAAYDAVKKIQGRKRHILVDTLGLLLVVVVTVAAVQDRDGAKRLLSNLPGGCKKLRRIWVDGGYRGRLIAWVIAHCRARLAVVLRSDDQTGFVVLPRRWVVELTFAWLNANRRLSKDYEGLTTTSESMIYLAMIRLMLRRLGSA